jgi:DNA-binding MarR family transcriptional regulator
MPPKTPRQRRNAPPAHRRRHAVDSGGPLAVNMGELPFLVGYALRRAQLVIFQDFYRTFAEVRIRPAQFAILTVLERNPGLKQTDVAAVLGIKRTNFVVLLDELERRGLAQRRAAAGDRRPSALFLTEKGRALLRKLNKMVAAHEKRVTARIGAMGRKHLFKLLHRLAEERD